MNIKQGNTSYPLYLARYHASELIPIRLPEVKNLIEEKEYIKTPEAKRVLESLSIGSGTKVNNIKIRDAINGTLANHLFHRKPDLLLCMVFGIMGFMYGIVGSMNFMSPEIMNSPLYITFITVAFSAPVILILVMIKKGGATT